MKIIQSKQEMTQLIHALKIEQKQIGFVPTMGFLHEGHLELMKQAKNENDIVVASIFVNPLQFGPNEDYEKYPRNEEKDAKLAEEVGVDILFIPTAGEMYPKPMVIKMAITERVDVLCGKSRPGHFDGVLTVLTKLFHMVHPDKAYFGLKDAQQVAVVDALIQDLNFPIQLVGLPTVREEDGLAKSSRNVNLSATERAEAVWIHKGLQAGRELVLKGEQDPQVITQKVTAVIEQHVSGKIDYVELLSYPSLEPVTVVDQNVILATAVYFEHARLIDNLLMRKDGEIMDRYS